MLICGIALLSVLFITHAVIRHCCTVPVKYIYHRNGITSIIDFETGSYKSVPTETYCVQAKKNIMWARQEDELFSAENIRVKAYTIYLTYMSGETQEIFNTSQLYRETGIYLVRDFTFTENHRIIFTGKVGEYYYLYEYNLDQHSATLLYPEAVFGTFSVDKLDLLFTTNTSKSTRDNKIVRLNLLSDQFSVMCQGTNASILHPNVLLYGAPSIGATLLHNTDSGLDTHVVQKHGPKEEIVLCFTSHIAPSSDPKVAIIFYYTSVGANDEAPQAGILNFETNSVVSLDWYFKWILLRNVPDIPYNFPGHSMSALL